MEYKVVENRDRPRFFKLTVLGIARANAHGERQAIQKTVVCYPVS